MHKFGIKTALVDSYHILLNFILHVGKNFERPYKCLKVVMQITPALNLVNQYISQGNMCCYVKVNMTDMYIWDIYEGEDVVFVPN